MSSPATELRLPPSPKVRTRQDGTRSRILQESARLFVQKGFENVSVEDILAAASLARSSFYRFFSNRGEVLAAIIRPVFERGNELLTAIEPGSARSVLGGIFDAYLALWHDGPDALRLATRTGGPYFEIFSDLHRPFRERITELLRMVEPSGHLLNGNALQTARLIARTTVPVMEVYHTDPNFHALFHKTMSGFLLAPET